MSPQSGSRHGARRSRRRTWVMAAVIPLGVVVSGALVLQASYAAFTAQTSNAGNTWSTGTVALTSSQSGSVGWSPADNLTHGDTGSTCITVSYTGTLDASVTMSTDVTDGGLAADLTMTVESFASADCTGTAVETVSDTLAGLDSRSILTWSATENTQRSYQVTYLVETTATQGETASAVFTWTASSGT